MNDTTNYVTNYVDTSLMLLSHTIAFCNTRVTYQSDVDKLVKMRMQSNQRKYLKTSVNFTVNSNVNQLEYTDRVADDAITCRRQ